LDLVPSRHTQIVGTVADRELVRRAIRDSGPAAIVHAAALHKPNIETHRALDFVAVNVQGTLNLLEEAVASKVDRFIFTSTTSLMISREIRVGGVRPLEEGGMDYRGNDSASSPQHLWGNQTRSRTSLPPVSRAQRVARHHPAHIAILPRGG
jgi:nucleoside-diphosphate-sugar epimerase